MRKVKVTKLEDNKFKGIHPHNINVGYTKTGIEFNPPKVGESYIVSNFYTSAVIEIVDENTFKTENSTYKIEYLD